MMSVDLIYSAQADVIQDATALNMEGSNSFEKDKRPLKRPHVPFQESSMGLNEKSSKLPRSSEPLPAGQATRNERNDTNLQPRSGNEVSHAGNLKEVARESLRCIDPGYLPDDDDDNGSNRDGVSREEN